jgi:hypothetical protein
MGKPSKLKYGTQPVKSGIVPSHPHTIVGQWELFWYMI